ncbi:MAG: DUF1015 domain-containing protein [Hyphomicrobiales bacterium]|nr:DUF1015 domain-containing protein [Hyphomicrobiales bacterium]
MTLIKPFRGLRPAPGRAEDVIAPPYDVLDTEEARRRASGKPWSFLHISKAEIDLPEGTDHFDSKVYEKAAANMAELIDKGILLRDPEQRYYVYRLDWGDHAQTGIVAAASVSEYDDGRIKKHEHTRPDKEDDRVRQIEAIGAQTGPVKMAYPHAPEIDEILTAASTGKADIDVVADDGIRHRLWVIANEATIARLTAAFEKLSALYIADGHHRSAAASRVSANLHAAGKIGPEDQNDYFLAVVFPHHQVKILDYNRVVRDLGNLSPEAFLAKIETAFSVVREQAPVRPQKPHEFGMYLAGQWYRLTIDPNRVPDDPVGRLDVSLLHDHLIEPFLGISDPRRDKRIDFVGGMRGLEELQRRVDSGEMAAAFSLFPTSLDDLMAVADAGDVMPPKSTWFEPKLADGLVSRLLIG